MIAFLFTHIFFNTFLQPQLTHHVLVCQRKVVKYMFINIAYRAINIKNGINDDYIPEK